MSTMSSTFDQRFRARGDDQDASKVRRQRAAATVRAGMGSVELFSRVKRVCGLVEYVLDREIAFNLSMWLKGRRRGVLMFADQKDNKRKARKEDPQPRHDTILCCSPCPFTKQC